MKVKQYFSQLMNVLLVIGDELIGIRIELRKIRQHLTENDPAAMTTSQEK